MASFAILAAEPYGDKGLGILMGFWDADTSTNWVFNVTNNVVFAPAYNAILETCSNITFEMQFLAPVARLADVTFTLLNKRVHNSPGGETRLSDRFAAGLTWYGNTITIRQLAYDAPTGTTYTNNIWSGYLTQCRITDERIEFTAIAAPNWKLRQLLPTDVVSLSTYPDCGPSSVGLAIPLVFGDNEAIPWTTTLTDTYKKNAELMGLADLGRLVPAVLTDRNLGSTDGAVYTVASHALKSFPVSSTDGIFTRITGLDQSCPVYGGDFALDNTGPATITFDDPFKFYGRFDPTEEAAANTVTNIQNVTDKDTTTYAQTDSTHLICALQCNAPDGLGQITEVKVWCIYESDLDAPNEKLRLGIWDNDAADWWGTYTEISSATSAKMPFSHTVSDYETITWITDFPANFCLRAEHVGFQAGNWIKVYELCLVVQFRGTVLTEQQLAYQSQARGQIFYPRVPPVGLGRPVDQLPDKVYVSCKGKADDGFGTYTGTASALIESPVSVAAYIAVTAGCSLVASGHGLLDTARTDQNTDSLATRLWLGECRAAADIVSDICLDSTAGTFVVPGSAMRLGFVYWASAAADNLYGTIYGQDIETIEIGWTGLEDVRNAIYVACDYNYRLGKCEKLVWCDGAGSDDGTGVDDYYTEKAKLATSEADYGRHELHLDARTITVAGAIAVRNNLADMLYQPRVALRMRLPWKYYGLQPGHTIAMDNDSCLALGWKYPGQTDSTDGAWAHGGTTRYFWIERVSFSEDAFIDVEATEGVW